MMKITIPSLGIVFFAVFLVGCNTIKQDDSGGSIQNTKTNYSGLTLDLDPEKDIPEYKRNLLPVAELPDLDAYLNTLLSQIIDANQLGEVFVNKWPKVKVSVDTSFNAITLENGLIIVNVGMLAQLETEAELQAVLSHELVHLLNKDHQKDNLHKGTGKLFDLGKTILAQKYTGASSKQILSKALPEIISQQILDDVVNGFAFTKWNREQELNSDLRGVHLMHRAGINEKYMLKFLNKRKDFEVQNKDIFESQNNEDTQILGTVKSFFSGLSKDEDSGDTGKQSLNDSMTGNYYTADTRYQKVKQVLIEEIGKENLNSRVKTERLSTVMPSYQKVLEVYEVRNVNNILNDESLSELNRFRKARDLVKVAREGGLEDNSYLSLVLASVYESRKTAARYAPQYREIALKDSNATLLIYSNLIAYYDGKNDREIVLALLEKVNSEMDYPNSYLPSTLKYQKKYRVATDKTELQCVRTLDTRVVRACQEVMGRPLKASSKSLFN